MATTSEITDIIKAQIQKFEGRAESVDVGTVVEIGDGIARIHGLAACMASELLDFGKGVRGLAFNLEEDTVSAIILGDYTGIEEGGEVRTTGRIVETAVGPVYGPATTSTTTSSSVVSTAATADSSAWGCRLPPSVTRTRSIRS